MQVHADLNTTSGSEILSRSSVAEDLSDQNTAPEATDDDAGQPAASAQVPLPPHAHHASQLMCAGLAEPGQQHMLCCDRSLV